MILGGPAKPQEARRIRNIRQGADTSRDTEQQFLDNEPSYTTSNPWPLLESSQLASVVILAGV
jgi:hypothetical protein